jgi:hypothetical protein
LKALNAFKDELKGKALYNEFDSDQDLRRKAHRALSGVMSNALNVARGVVSAPKRAETITPDAMELLLEGSRDQFGSILSTRTFDGDSIRTNGREFVEERNVRSSAKWKAALEVLGDNNLAKQTDLNGEIFEVTHAGFSLAEEKEAEKPLQIEITPTGHGSEHTLVIRANRKIRLLHLAFMTSQEIAMSEQSINEEGDHFVIKIDQPALTKLFNTPRSDSNRYDLSGPMKLALTLSVSGLEHTVTVPAQLENNLNGNTAYREISRSPFCASIK